MSNQSQNAIRPVGIETTPNSIQNNENRPIYRPVPPRINDFAEEMLTAITIRMQEEGWTFMSFIRFLNMLSPTGFQSKPIEVLELQLREEDEKFVPGHAEKDEVCIGTNCNQIVARIAFGKHKTIYAKFNRLCPKGEFNVKVGNKYMGNRMTYTLDSESIELFEVDLLQVNERDNRHRMSKIEQNIKLPYVLHIKFTNGQSDSVNPNDRLKSQEFISSLFNENFNEFFYTTQCPIISTLNENADIKPDMTHEVIIDVLIKSVFDLKELYCQLFNNLRLCFVRASDIQVTEKASLFTFDGINYCIGCYRYTENKYIISLSDNEYRQKLKNFFKGEHIKYGSKDGYGEAHVTPDALYYRVGKLNDVKDKVAVDNFVTNDLTFTNRIINLKDPIDKLNSFYGFQDCLKVSFGAYSLVIENFFNNNQLRQTKALIDPLHFKFDNFGYADCDDVLKHIFEYNVEGLTNVLNNIDRSMISEFCEKALYSNEIPAIINWVKINWALIIRMQSPTDLYLIDAPDCLAMSIIESNNEKYKQDLDDLENCFKRRNLKTLSEILWRLGTNLNEDFSHLPIQFPTISKITYDFFTESIINSIKVYIKYNSVFDIWKFVHYLKLFLLIPLMYKDLNTEYNFFGAINWKLMNVYGFDSNSELSDYMRSLNKVTQENKDDVEFDLDNIKIPYNEHIEESDVDNNEIEPIVMKNIIDNFFKFQTNFRTNSGYEKLFVKLASK